MKRFFLFLCCTCALSNSPSSIPEAKHQIEVQSFYLMGTLVEIVSVAPEEQVAKNAVQKAFESLSRVDKTMSDYDQNSEISRVSQHGFSQAISISSETISLLRFSQEMSEKTQGAFDITIGPLVDLWRVAEKRQALPTKEEITSAKARVGYQAVLLDEKESTVRLQLQGMRLDLGGVAKGFALDLAKDAMYRAGALGGRITLGGQILVFGQIPDSFRRIPLRDPRSPQKMLGEILLENISIATTADYERGKQIGNSFVSHVIDPRTGEPVKTLLAVMVIAPKAVDADVLSTALFTLGEEAGRALVQKENAQAIFVRLDGTIIFTKGFPKNRLTGFSE